MNLMHTAAVQKVCRRVEFVRKHKTGAGCVQRQAANGVIHTPTKYKGEHRVSHEDMHNRYNTCKQWVHHGRLSGQTALQLSRSMACEGRLTIAQHFT